MDADVHPIVVFGCRRSNQEAFPFAGDAFKIGDLGRRPLGLFTGRESTAGERCLKCDDKPADLQTPDDFPHQNLPWVVFANWFEQSFSRFGGFPTNLGSATSSAPSETTYCRCSLKSAGDQDDDQKSVDYIEKPYPPRSHPKRFELVERLKRFELTLWLPATAEGAVKLDDGVELRSARARKIQLGSKKVLVSD